MYQKVGLRAPESKIGDWRPLYFAYICQTGAPVRYPFQASFGQMLKIATLLGSIWADIIFLRRGVRSGVQLVFTET